MVYLNTFIADMKYLPQDGFPYYLGLAGSDRAISLFRSNDTFEFLDSLNEQTSNSRYAPDKWSIKQVVGHIVDHERIKINRAFFLSRGQDLELWGYDQESLVNGSRFDELSFVELLNDFKNVRAASISLIEGFSAFQLALKGQARQYEVTLEEFLKSIIGHERHHITIIQERYQV
ncbi:DinB family protein [Roseivirga sp. E12]|uniref:DinB family protein n=1 Tax=Roseivirga sp. E12 TaxID=2819237 RepID=UPI001ABC1EBE|nr:DinB family protein [Roseivirga sp. E12]MBO3697064.1 DinB family protein [Roseivirga sp. E12]